MNILLDTQILLWALSNNDKLSDLARSLILDPKNNIYYSSASIWEITIKHLKHPDTFSFSGKDVSQYCRDAGYLQVRIIDEHCYTIESLKRKENSPEHNDPFDKLLISQAKCERLTLITHDSLIPDYEEDCILSV